MEQISPLISIVVPCFNRANYLPGLLDGINSQNFRDWQIVLVDDGSIDNTREVVDPYLRDKRICYFAKPNGGVSEARNAGAEFASGEYLVFLDSDDQMKEGTLEAFANTIHKTEADVLFSSCHVVRDGKSRTKEPGNLGKMFNGVKGLFLAGCFCIRRKTFNEAGGYAVSLKFGENYELGIRVCKLGIITAIVDHVTVDYFIDSQKRTSNSIENKLYSNLFILQKYEALLKSDSHQLSVLLSQTGYFYRALGDRATARHFYGKSFLANPFNARNLYRLFSSFT